MYKKGVDWSALHEGITIPVIIQTEFMKMLSGYHLQVGERKEIRIVIGEEIFHAKLINQPFNREKYPTHKEMIQIRYSPNSGLSSKLREVFGFSYNHFHHKRNDSLSKDEIQLWGNEKSREDLVIYTSDMPDTLIVESFPVDELKTANEIIPKMSEEEFETSMNYEKTDWTARVEEKMKTMKIRRLNRAIGNNLKVLYNNNCQICGTDFGKPYSCGIVEVHHIVPFVKSMNNDYSNLAIICPNHHRLIHKLEAGFDHEPPRFEYSNGIQDILKMNEHL